MWDDEQVSSLQGIPEHFVQLGFPRLCSNLATFAH